MLDTPDDTAEPIAGENPWFVLMTVAGVVPDWPEVNFHDRNRRYWTGWQAQALSDEEKAALAASGRARTRDLVPLTEDEQAAIARELALRSPEADLPRPGGAIDLTGAVFEAELVCEGFVFAGELILDGAEFRGPARFARAIFRRDAGFAGAAFGAADFAGAEFEGAARFAGAGFAGGLDCTGARFAGRADFSGAAFAAGADFTDCTFAAATRFDRSGFGTGAPPFFFGAHLHEDTSFDAVRWPEVPTEPEAARTHARAYERLKLMMHRHLRFSDQHMLLRRELACREAAAPGTWQSLLSRAFGAVADYGWSAGRPLGILAGVWAAGAAAIYASEGGQLGAAEAAGTSFANLFALLGTGRLMPEGLGAAATAITGLQMVAGPVLLLLTAVALRNRFRVR